MARRSTSGAPVTPLRGNPGRGAGTPGAGSTRAAGRSPRREPRQARGRYVELEGRGRIWVREAGRPGDPSLVLLHGLGATASLNWDACLPELSRRYHVLAPDHRGHGRGIRCGSRFTLEDCAEDAAALIAQEVGGPAIVAGYSMGGPIATLLCRRHPELVAGLILCATARDFRGSPADKLEFGVLGLLALISRLLPCPPELVPDAIRRHGWFGPAVDELCGHQPLALLSAAASLGSFTSRAWVGELDVPAVVVVTEADRTVPARRQLKLAASLPDCRVLRIGAGHFAPQREPDRFAATLRQASDLLARRRRRLPWRGGVRRRRHVA